MPTYDEWQALRGDVSAALCAYFNACDKVLLNHTERELMEMIATALDDAPFTQPEDSE